MYKRTDGVCSYGCGILFQELGMILADQVAHAVEVSHDLDIFNRKMNFKEQRTITDLGISPSQPRCVPSTKKANASTA